MGPKRARVAVARLLPGGGGRGSSGGRGGRGGRGRGSGGRGGSTGRGGRGAFGLRGDSRGRAHGRGRGNRGHHAQNASIHGSDLEHGPSGMVWPPVVRAVNIHGEIKDMNGRNIPRDQGRSFELGGYHYYVFGDTFCHDDSGNFVGTTDNTIAYIPDISRPNLSQYLSEEPRVPQFIPYTESEFAYTNAPENRNRNSRIVLWSFGGVIEDTPGCGMGWVFFDKLITNGASAGHVFGMSVARVRLENGYHVQVDRIMGDELIFGSNEPRFGSISTLADSDGYVYLFGHRDESSPFDLRNHWARIQRSADFTKRSNYEFLLNNGTWSTSYTPNSLKRVMDVQAQGGFVNLPGFAPGNKGPYMWFGVSKYMANALYVGTAKKLTGSWDVKEVMSIPKVLGDGSAARYCLYPHPWGADLSRGQMLVSWSDNRDFGGRVICATLTFAMAGEPSDMQQTSQQVQAQPDLFDVPEVQDVYDGPPSRIDRLVDKFKAVFQKDS